MTELFAVCGTSGCGNAGLPVSVPADAVVVVCGPCGHPIAELTSDLPILPEELPSWDI